MRKPSAPSLETDLFLPLGIQRASAGDLVSDRNHIASDSTSASGLALEIRGTLNDFTVGDLLDVRLPGTASNASVSSIVVRRPADVRASYTIHDLCSAAPVDSESVVLPPFSFLRDELTTGPQASVRYVHLRSGRLLLRVENGLPISLAPAAGQEEAIGVRVLDHASGQVLGEATRREEVPPSGSADLEAGLSGVSYQGQLDFEVWGASPGSPEEPVLVGSRSRALRLVVQFIPQEADSALSTFDAQLVSGSASLPLADDLRLQHGPILEGRVALKLGNELPVGGPVTVSFPDVVQGRYTFSRVLDLPAAIGGVAGTAEATLDFSGFTVMAPSGESLSGLSYTVVLAAGGSGDEPLPLGAHQHLRVQLDPAVVRFEYITGTFEGRRLALPSSHLSFQLPEGMDGIDLTRASFDLELENDLGTGAGAELSITGYDESGNQTGAIPLRFPISPPSTGEKARNRAHADETNSSILALLRGGTRSLVTAGEVVLGGDGTPGTITRRGMLTGTYTLSAPLRMKIGRIVRRGTPFHFNAAENGGFSPENVRAAFLNGTIENHLPARLTARVIFAAHPESLETTPDLALDSVQVEPGTIDPASGRVTEASLTPLSVTFASADIALLLGGEVYGQVVFSLSGPEPDQAVELSAADYVDVKAILQFRTRMGR